MTIWRSWSPLAVLLVVGGGCSDGPTLPQYEPDVQLTLVAGLPGGLIHLWSGEGNANDAVGTAHGRLGSTQFGAGLNGQAFSFNGTEPAIPTPWTRWSMRSSCSIGRSLCACGRAAGGGTPPRRPRLP